MGGQGGGEHAIYRVEITDDDEASRGCCARRRGPTGDQTAYAQAGIERRQFHAHWPSARRAGEPTHGEAVPAAVLLRLATVLPPSSPRRPGRGQRRRAGGALGGGRPRRAGCAPYTPSRRAGDNWRVSSNSGGLLTTRSVLP